MKNTYTYLLLLLILIIVTVESCKKAKCTDPICQLPPATQTGANTMGCLVNGKAWLPDTKDDGGIPRLPAISVSFWNTKTQLYLRFYRVRKPDNQDLKIYVTNFTGEGIYVMDSTSRIMGVPGSNGNLNNYFYYTDYNANTKYSTTENYKGKLTITLFDSVRQIISGSFSFKAKGLDGIPDSLQVSEGRFDCKMQ
jgi:hypothetical protein